MAQDFASGIALVQVEREDAPALAAATDELALAVGDEVFIVASVGGPARRASSGGITSLDGFDANWEYTLEHAIFSSAMNPGLGGGPLLDTLGNVVGVVSLNLNEIGRFSLSIPADYFLDARDSFVSGRSQAPGTRAWLGIFCYAVKDHVVIAGLLPGAPGEVAGLKAGDVVLAVDGQDVADRRSLYRLLWNHRPGEQVTLKIFRGRELHTVTVASGDVEEFFA